MKRIWIAPMAILTYLICTSSSCKHDDKQITPANNNTNTSVPVNTQGKWKVSYFSDKGNVETSDFAGYTFTFDNNVITATDGSTTISGSYATGTDDGHQKFIINFANANARLNELNEDWIIVTNTATELDLKDDNSNHNEEIHFTKQ